MAIIKLSTLLKQGLLHGRRRKPSSAMPPLRNLLLLGGSGFVGKAIGREALGRGWKVVSLSRHGSPSALPNNRMSWIKGNALDSSVYQPLIREHNIDTIIHSVGILYENNSKASASVKDKRTFEAVNRDTAIVAADEAAKSDQVRDFGFVSAAGFGPLTGHIFLKRYLDAKRQAEEGLKRHTAFRTTIARPGFMYGSDRAITYPISWGYRLLALFAGGLLPRTLHVDRVAKSLLDAIERSGPANLTLEVQDMLQ